MVYTEVSEYQYCTGDELEAFAINTYATTDTTYGEAAVMEQVSQAERWVNEYCGQTFTAGAAPDGVKSATLIMATYFMNMKMLADKHIDELPIKLSAVESLCRGFLTRNKVSIPYTSSISDYDLRLLRG